MNFDEYLARYRMLQLSVENDKRILELAKDDNYSNFVKIAARFTGLKANEKNMLLPYDGIEERAALRERLLSRYAVRLARACDLIKYPPVREYALFRYVYSMTNSTITNSTFYAERTVYRHAAAAKRELKKNLLKVMPKLKKVQHKKFCLSHEVHVRDYTVPPEVQKKLRVCRNTSVKAFRIKYKSA